MLVDHLHVAKKSVEEARERWLDYEESGLIDDLAKDGLYARERRYPQAVRDLIEHHVINTYGIRNPGVIIYNKPRIELPFTLRDLSMLMLKEKEAEFLVAMKEVTWTSRGTTHKLPHPKFIEHYIRTTMPQVKKARHFGEYFFCKHCLEKDKSWKAVITALKKMHKNWSPECKNAKCACGAFEYNRNVRLRNKKRGHVSCTGSCICDDCNKLFQNLSSFIGFLYDRIENAGCTMVEGMPTHKCRTQSCDQCNMADLLSLKKFQAALNLPFPIDMAMPTHTYKTKNKIREVERAEQKPKGFVYKHTEMTTVAFETAWKFLFEEHPEVKNGTPFATSFLAHRAQVDWFNAEFARLIDRNNPALPVGTLLITNDFSESPFYQLKDQTSDMIYCQQPILLGPTPCFFTTENDKGGRDVHLVVLNFLAEDAKHSSPRVLQIFEHAYLYMDKYIQENYGAFG